jgi:Flp pilus assembly protein TadD
LCRAGKIGDAIGHFTQALRLKPDSPEVHGNLGLALELAGQTNNAIGQYEQALRLNPEYAQAQKGLARLRMVQ